MMAASGRAFLILAAAIVAAVGFALHRNEHVYSNVEQLIETLAIMRGGGSGSVREFSSVIVYILAAVFTLTSFLLSRMNGGVFPALTLSTLVILGGWMFENRVSPMFLAPTMASLAVMSARSENGKMVMWTRALPVALIAAALALMFIPSGRLTWAPLEEVAENVRRMFDDYLMFDDARVAYSISADGYQQGGEILGGPAAPREDEVMRVSTDAMLMLRGTVKRTYTGYSWTDTVINNRYLFVDITRNALRDRIFNLDLADSLRGVTVEREIQVEFLSPGTSTLFIPDRLISLSTSIAMPAYYNDNGEAFLTRGVVPGDSYSMRVFLISSDDIELANVTLAARSADHGEYDKMKNAYTNVSNGVQRGVYELTERAIAGAETPYQKAMAIRHFLTTNYAYNLNVERVPRNTDFVSYFLLASKEGYCSYFASAMAIMARIAGLPARYTEGYIATPGKDGEALVRGADAHAWVEIYFDGVGWLSFDATPGNDRSDSGTESTETTPENNLMEEPTPEPTPEPTHSPEPEGDQSEDSADEETTPEPQGDPPSADSEPPPGDEPNSDYRIWVVIALIAIILALIIWLLIWRIKKTDPKRQTAGYNNGSIKLMIWYRAMLSVLTCSGHSPNPGETPVMFADRLVSDGAVTESFRQFASIVSFSRYAGKAPDMPVYELAAKVYDDLRGGLRFSRKLRWFAGRLFYGPGDFNQIP
jgi:transglutaminase-like putative cysteine protease